MLEHQTIIVIESDNCKVQYKSSAHFWSIQEMANNYPVPIICVFSIAKHDKVEVDHVGGLTKTTIPVRKIAGFDNVAEFENQCC